jgi:hypothetical protein
MNYRLKILLLLFIGVLFQTGCGTEAAYTGESFSSDSPFKLRVDSEVDAACESARRSLLGQGYLIDLASSEEVKARKAARIEGQQNAFIEMTVVCVPERGGSTVFATGVLSTYDLKKNSSSASVGLSALGSISLPIGQSVDSLVKVSEQTIDDKEFYKRFFTAVETILGEMRFREAADDSVTEPAQEDAAPEAGQPVTQPRIWPELFPEQVEPAVTTEPSATQLAPEALPAPVAVPAPETYSQQVVPEAVPVPVAVPVPAPAPETYPQQVAPEAVPVPVAVPVPAPAPETNPQQVAPEITPEPVPANTAPVMSAKPIPQQPAPVTATAPLPQAEPAVTTAAPVPNAAPSDLNPSPAPGGAVVADLPVPAPDTVPPVIPSTTGAVEEPVGIASDAPPGPTTSVVAVPGLAPIQVTAVRKATSKPAAEVPAVPQAAPQDSTSKVDSLF